MASGLCGIFDPNQNIVKELIYSIIYLQTRALDFSGISIHNKELLTERLKGNINQAFPMQKITKYKEEIIRKRYEGHTGIAAVHKSKDYGQPFPTKAKFGNFSLAYDGGLTNLEQLKKELLQRGKLAEGTSTEVIAKLIAQKNDIISGIEHMNAKVRGGFSLLAAHEGDIIAATDPLGFKPLVIGGLEGRVVVASETEALRRAGIPIEHKGKYLHRDVMPGEVIRISEDGIKTVAQLENYINDRKSAHCAFEHCYTLRPDSIWLGASVDSFRKEIGKWHYEQDKADGLEVDSVGGVPMSGTLYAYAGREGLLEHVRIFVYNRSFVRSFNFAEQKDRRFTADGKCSVITDAVKGKRVKVTEDSIVFGNVMKRILHDVKNEGAEKIHVRVSWPPYKELCILEEEAKRKRSELAFHNYGGVEGVKKHIGADSLKYTDPDAWVSCMTKLNGLCGGDLCMRCAGFENPLFTEG